MNTIHGSRDTVDFICKDDTIKVSLGGRFAVLGCDAFAAFTISRPYTQAISFVGSDQAGDYIYHTVRMHVVFGGIELL